MSNAIATTKPSAILPNEAVLSLFPIDVETLEAVKDSIKKNGILTPILVGNDAVIIDGHTRWTAAQSLKLREVPFKVMDNMAGASDAGVDFALQLQMGRRNLTTKQKIEKIGLTLELHPKWSDRQISRTYGVSPTTVGKVRDALKAGGKIEDVNVREDAKGRTQDVSDKRTRNQSAQGGADKAKRLPSALLVSPEITGAEVAAAQYDVDQLNALRQWADLIGRFLKTNPKPFSKAEADAAKAAAKQVAKAEAAAKAAKEKAEAAAKALADAKAGKMPAPKAATKGAAKKGAAKAAKKGRK